MIAYIDKARYVGDYKIWLRFDDGPVFEPLRRVEFFRSFLLHPELKTLVWPNGADFAPEFLHEKVRSQQRIAGRH